MDESARSRAGRGCYNLCQGASLTALRIAKVTTCRKSRQNASGEAHTPETWVASFLAETHHLSEARRQIGVSSGRVRPLSVPAVDRGQIALRFSSSIQTSI